MTVLYGQCLGINLAGHREPIESCYLPVYLYRTSLIEHHDALLPPFLPEHNTDLGDSYINTGVAGQSLS